MATSQATENNQKLFRRYAKMFTLTDPNIYISHAEKLSLWLNDFKAYYATARPEIVKLLLIAQVTLRRTLGLPEHFNSPFNILEYSEHPMTKSYIKLVKSVEPFENYFTEPGLLAHVRTLLASVSPPHTLGGTQQPMPHFQSDIPAHPHASETLALPSSVSETQITESSNTMSSSSAPRILPVAAKASVKSKKRKPVDFDRLVQRDLKALVEKQRMQGTSSPHNIEPSMVLPNPLGDHPPSEQASPVIESQDSLPRGIYKDQKMAAPAQITESLPSLDTIVATEAQGSSSPAYEDQIMAAPSQIMESLPSHWDTSVTTEAQGSSSACEDQIMAAPGQVTESLPFQDMSATAEVQGSRSPASEDQIMDAPDQIPEPLLSRHTSVVAAAQGTSAQAVTEDREMTPPDSVMEFPNLQKVIAPQGYSSPNVTEDQEMESVDTTEAPLPSEDAGVATELQDSSCPVTEEQDRQEVVVGDSRESGPLPSQISSTTIETQESAPLLFSRESGTASFQLSPQRNITPLASGNHSENPSSLVQDVPPLVPPASANTMVKDSSCSTTPACKEKKFGQEMRIVAMGQGLSKGCKMTFTCTISSAVFPKVSAWLNRNTFSLNVEQSICLSLGCYSIADLQEQSTKNKCTTLEQQTSVARSHWPQTGGLSMNVQLKNGREDLPLSPPFQVTPDGLVDVSQSLFSGKNVIELNQTTDMSQYMFVLHSHFPTRAQLQEVDERRQRETEWQEWIRHLSRPFDIPLKLIKT